MADDKESTSFIIVICEERFCRSLIGDIFNVTVLCINSIYTANNLSFVLT